MKVWVGSEWAANRRIWTSRVFLSFVCKRVCSVCVCVCVCLAAGIGGVHKAAEVSSILCYYSPDVLEGQTDECAG